MKLLCTVGIHRYVLERTGYNTDGDLVYTVCCEKCGKIKKTYEFTPI